jgi:hypothetical protein
VERKRSAIAIVASVTTIATLFGMISARFPSEIPYGLLVGAAW